jgi:guanylate kinase
LSASPEGHLVVVSGPSGVGKSSILAGVLAASTAVFSTSATTRAPRRNEVDGREYHFIDRGDFEALIADGDVLEWAEYGGNLYGTLRREVEPLIAAGSDVILDIENEGAKQIRSSYPSAVMVFIRPPDLDVLHQRLTERGDTSARDIERRLSVARAQIDEAPAIYDHIVLNDELDTAIGRVLDILSSLSDDGP